MGKHTIYGWRTPDHRFHYVGITENMRERYSNHSYSQIETPVTRLFDQGENPIMIALDEVETKEEAGQRETFWIRYFSQAGDPIKNRKEGAFVNQKIAQTIIEDILHTGRPITEILDDFEQRKRAGTVNDMEIKDIVRIDWRLFTQEERDNFSWGMGRYYTYLLEEWR